MRYRTPRAPSRPRSSPLRCESLESRTVPAVITLLQVHGGFGLEQVVVGTFGGNGVGHAIGLGNASYTPAVAHVTFVNVTYGLTPTAFVLTPVQAAPASAAGSAGQQGFSSASPVTSSGASAVPSGGAAAVSAPAAATPSAGFAPTATPSTGFLAAPAPVALATVANPAFFGQPNNPSPVPTPAVTTTPRADSPATVPSVASVRTTESPSSEFPFIPDSGWERGDAPLWDWIFRLEDAQPIVVDDAEIVASAAVEAAVEGTGEGGEGGGGEGGGGEGGGGGE